MHLRTAHAAVVRETPSWLRSVEQENIGDVSGPVEIPGVDAQVLPAGTYIFRFWIHSRTGISLIDREMTMRFVVHARPALHVEPRPLIAQDSSQRIALPRATETRRHGGTPGRGHFADCSFGYSGHGLDDNRSGSTACCGRHAALASRRDCSATRRRRWVPLKPAYWSGRLPIGRLRLECSRSRK